MLNSLCCILPMFRLAPISLLHLPITAPTFFQAPTSFCPLFMFCTVKVLSKIVRPKLFLAIELSFYKRILQTRHYSKEVNEWNLNLVRVMRFQFLSNGVCSYIRYSACKFLIRRQCRFTKCKDVLQH